MAHDFLPSLTGSFAQPASENPTVMMVEAAYRHHNLHWRYINCEVSPDNLASAVKGALAMGWKGFNCSIPHKVKVIEFLDALGESAQIIGAVNTVVNRDGRLIGENTDGKGFVQALRKVVDPKGKNVVLLGAGGAARAVAVEMALAGVEKITIVNRNVQRGEELTQLVADKTPAKADFIAWDSVLKVPEETDILINATSIGLYPNVDAIPNVEMSTLEPSLIVADGIPNPPQTRFLKEARAKGCITVDGLGMLVQQGVLAIHYWTGVDVDPNVMRQALLDLGL
ncbi:shikimate dehydrogenase [Aristophania vespae]|uniref:Shikimate dehydrogenase (NADP(+)) n=1 Tax=Aristophania vespae TaxID=2697033 RepID=A0A6P1NI30_9PROT|nr:shikimate dehydrogenase [Aristophania vespae]QHI96184.1 shikimate dehydrogenase [Aristophania vespae]UMM63974.1 Shikimate dehydrogenase (NADP(+)) [Aristophania vespae]